MSKFKSLLLCSIAGLAFSLAGCSSDNVTGVSTSEQNSSKNALIFIYDDPSAKIDSMSIPLKIEEWEIIQY